MWSPAYRCRTTRPSCDDAATPETRRSPIHISLWGFIIFFLCTSRLCCICFFFSRRHVPDLQVVGTPMKMLRTMTMLTLNDNGTQRRRLLIILLARARATCNSVFCTQHSRASHSSCSPVRVEVFVGLVGHGVRWDVVAEYHVVPVHRAMCKARMLSFLVHHAPLNSVSHSMAD